MTDISQPQNLKVLGNIKKTRVTMLIDSVSSHNFIDTKIEKTIKHVCYPSFDLQVAIPGKNYLVHREMS
jgi:hypothetical protein